MIARPTDAFAQRRASTGAQQRLFGAQTVSTAMDEARDRQPAQGRAGAVHLQPPPDNRPRMPWGPHYGKPLDEVPLAYMQACLRLGADKLAPWLELEFKTRLNLITPPEPPGKSIPLSDLRGVIKRNYFTMSKQLHPDAGGTPEGMAILSIVNDSLKTILTEWEKTH